MYKRQVPQLAEQLDVQGRVAPVSYTHLDVYKRQPLTTAAKRTWTKAFSEQMVHLGEGRPDVVAITAAMLHLSLIHI